MRYYMIKNNEDEHGKMTPSFFYHLLFNMGQQKQWGSFLIFFKVGMTPHCLICLSLSALVLVFVFEVPCYQL